MTAGALGKSPKVRYRIPRPARREFRQPCACCVWQSAMSSYRFLLPFPHPNVHNLRTSSQPARPFSVVTTAAILTLPARSAFPQYLAPMASGRRQYPFHLIEPKWQSHWDAAADLSRLEPGRSRSRQPSLCAAPRRKAPAGATAQVLHPRHVPLPVRRGAARRAPGRLHRHGHPRPLPPRAAASTCCIRWAGTPSACPPSNTPSRPASIRARPPRQNIATFKRQIKSPRLQLRLDAARSTPPTRSTSSGRSGFSCSSTTRGSIPQTNKAEPIETLPYPPELE